MNQNDDRVVIGGIYMYRRQQNVRVKVTSVRNGYVYFIQDGDEHLRNIKDFLDSYELVH